MRDFSVSLGVVEVFGFCDVAESQFITVVSKERATVRAQDVQDSLTLEDGIATLPITNQPLDAP